MNHPTPATSSPLVGSSLHPLPVPLGDLTPDHLVGMTQIHALDPAGSGQGLHFMIPGRGGLAGGAERTLVVYIDHARMVANVAALRGLIAAAARNPDGLSGDEWVDRD
jgi:hypothetical protein